MHRIRHSVWYFEALGWKPTVMMVDESFVETSQDHLLLQTVPSNLELHKVKAFSTSWTRKLGLGALALRSLFFYFKLVNAIIKKNKPDLIYFSTTQFPVLVLGRYWKWRFKIPYIIDMQDPWHSDYYQDKPKHERPAKYWFSYRLNRCLEPIAMRGVDGIISVSQGYCDMLQKRYKNITPENCTVIPFGAFQKDFEIKVDSDAFFNSSKNQINIRYIGRGGADMHTSLKIIFAAFCEGLKSNFDVFSQIRFEFIGTSYAANGKGIPSIMPLAFSFGLDEYVVEITDRMPYFEALNLLQSADILLIPGSDDPNYTASKLYPYIMAQKPILAVFSEKSSVVAILEQTNAGSFISFKSQPSQQELETYSHLLLQKWLETLQKLPFKPATNWKAFEPYTALEMTKKQVHFFDSFL